MPFLLSYANKPSLQLQLNPLHCFRPHFPSAALPSHLLCLGASGSVHEQHIQSIQLSGGEFYKIFRLKTEPDPNNFSPSDSPARDPELRVCRPVWRGLVPVSGRLPWRGDRVLWRQVPGLRRILQPPRGQPQADPDRLPQPPLPGHRVLPGQHPARGRPERVRLRARGACQRSGGPGQVIQSTVWLKP